MIVKPKCEDMSRYLQDCLQAKKKRFVAAWTHIIAPSLPPKSQNCSKGRIEHQFSRILGFRDTFDMTGELRKTDGQYIDPRFYFIDLDYDLMSHVGDEFLTHLQELRCRLSDITGIPMRGPASFFSILPKDHGTLELALLYLYRIPPESFGLLLNSLLILDSGCPILTSSGSEPTHTVLHVEDPDTTMADVLATVQVPSLAFAERHELTPEVSQRFKKGEISLLPSGPFRRDKWSVEKITQCITRMLAQDCEDNMRWPQVREFILYMINWMVTESDQSYFQVTFERLAAATNLDNYHANNLRHSRNSLSASSYVSLIAPSVFLSDKETPEFQLICKKIAYGGFLKGEDYARYETLFNKAKQLSKPVMGLILTTTSAHMDVMSPSALQPKSKIKVVESNNIIAASDLAASGGLVNAIKEVHKLHPEALSFGSNIITRLPSRELTEDEIKTLRLLKAYCDKEHLSLVFLSETKEKQFGDIFRDFRHISIVDGSAITNVSSNI